MIAARRLEPFTNSGTKSQFYQDYLGNWVEVGPGTTVQIQRDIRHIEVVNWANSIRERGADASETVLQAMDDFLDELEAAKIRKKIKRLNLFCGSNFQAARTPLITEAGFDGPDSELGDTYVYGQSTGLTLSGNNSKYNTGVTPRQCVNTNNEMGAGMYLRSDGSGEILPVIVPAGTVNYVSIALAFIGKVQNSRAHFYGTTDNAQLSGADNAIGFWSGCRLSGDVVLYKNKAVHAIDPSPTADPSLDVEHGIRGQSEPLNGLCLYWFGGPMDLTEISAFVTANQNFQTSLGRFVATP